MRLPGLGKIFVFKFQKRLSNLVWLEITRPRQCILSQKRRVTKFGEGRLNPTLVITLGKATRQLTCSVCLSHFFHSFYSETGFLIFINFIKWCKINNETDLYIFRDICIVHLGLDFCQFWRSYGLWWICEIQ